jgi:hypothetical protein
MTQRNLVGGSGHGVNPLKDSDPMPFGKHEGVKMEEVTDWPRVKAYIMRTEEYVVLYILWVICGILGMMIDVCRGLWKDEELLEAAPWFIFLIFCCGGLYLYGAAERWRTGK